jgi:hypothetical protein
MWQPPQVLATARRGDALVVLRLRGGLEIGGALRARLRELNRIVDFLRGPERFDLA